jgi:CMP-N-acetylneuraminic acid synthetase
MKEKILGIIPVRGGSKSIPRKNIKEFFGKPLMVWTIETAKNSGVLDRLIVSTDDEEIAEVAKKYGVEVPFMRPAELAQDTTPTLPVLQHAVQWLKDKENYWPDFVLLLEVVSPTKRPYHIQEAVKILTEDEKADSLITVTEAAAQYNPHWLMQPDEEGYVKLFTSEDLKDIIPRRQLLPKVYAKNGAFYLFKTDCLFRNPPSLFGDRAKLYIMSSEYNIDIDTPEDWPLAEERFKLILEKEKNG